ncbi:anti-sigma regulatory factor [Delftia sp. PS-11]|uniref:anti-sigma regulatory factor n=1 Tax=Delftia sp. PS-11 TaxID=2767222 RepID=UPI002453BF0C|nr:anti-sigma regulatory factor [Delftia sp. PS-11]KAJ8743718.1 anti-sigma regulatory factor [Delftia sp. PS-11]
MLQSSQSVVLHIVEDMDVVRVRAHVRSLASDMGFSLGDQTRLATAVSELSRNVLQYAGKGQCEIFCMALPSRSGLRLVFEDHGPGIADIDKAMQDGYSTSGGLGAGLPGTRRLVDEFSIESRPGLTRITIAMLRRHA